MRVKLAVCGWVALAAAGGVKLSAAVPAEFVNPPAEFRPMPFWSWNAALDDAEMRRQIVDFKDRGYGGYLMHPRVGLVTRYLGDEWFHKVQVCLDEGRKQGVQSWLYDEDKWPSGFAGGLAIFDHQEYIGMGMGVRRAHGPQAVALATNADVLATFDVQSNSVRRLASAADKAAGEVLQFFAQPYEKSNWYNGEAYLDTLNPEAVAHFLKLTITDGYDKHFKQDYGPAMPGIFTDEPNCLAGRGKSGTGFPWTKRFPEIFKQRRGYDLLDKLPCLVRPLPGHEQVRYDYWRTVAEQFEAAFSKQYGDQCERSGLKMTGHYLAEDTLVSQTRVGGSVMLQYPHEGIPGIDHLARNIRDPQTKKQCSSVADQFGKPRVLSEIYGVSGHSVTFEELKWMADYHFVLGVNLLVPHLTLYELAGDRKRDYPATFSYHQPYWEQLAPVNEYLGRAAWFITRGQPRQDVLLLSTLGSVWALFSPGDKADARADGYSKAFQTYVAELLAQHRDFHIGDEILMERHGRVEGGRLKISVRRAAIAPSWCRPRWSGRRRPSSCSRTSSPPAARCCSSATSPPRRTSCSLTRTRASSKPRPPPSASRSRPSCLMMSRSPMPGATRSATFSTATSRTGHSTTSSSPTPAAPTPTARSSSSRRNSRAARSRRGTWPPARSRLRT